MMHTTLKNYRLIISISLFLVLAFNPLKATGILDLHMDEDYFALRPHLHQTKYVLQYLLKKTKPISSSQPVKEITKQILENSRLFYAVYEEYLQAKMSQKKTLGTYDVYPYFRYNHQGTLNFAGFIKEKDRSDSSGLETGASPFLVTFRGKKLLDIPCRDFKTVFIDDVVFAQRLTRSERQNVKSVPHSKKKFSRKVKRQKSIFLDRSQ